MTTPHYATAIHNPISAFARFIESRRASTTHPGHVGTAGDFSPERILEKVGYYDGPTEVRRELLLAGIRRREDAVGRDEPTVCVMECSRLWGMSHHGAQKLLARAGVSEHSFESRAEALAWYANEGHKFRLGRGRPGKTNSLMRVCA